MTVIQFTPLSSLVQPAFWHDLVRLKIDVLKLSAESQPVTASYSAGKSIVDRETGQDVALGCQIALGGDAFDKQASIPAHTVAVCGVLKNFNTIEEFKSADKLALFNGLADELWTAVNSETALTDLSYLNKFLVLTFADLKKYKFFYWFAFPALVAKPAWEIDSSGWLSAEERLGGENLLSIYDSFSDFSQGKPSHPPYFIARQSAKYGYEVSSLSEWNSFFKDTPEDKRILGFVDPSANPQSPGWPLRNLLTLVNVRLGVKGPLNVLAWRDTEVTGPNHSWHSRLGVVSIPGVEQLDPQVRPTAVGWEKNTQGKLAPRLADLAPMMDPARLADQAVDLNLKLMRWRILPGLNLEKVAKTKCLLLGAGTLGCYVARTLMGWGVRTITFVDSARVSFSNPVRQPLFEFADCLEGGKPKAACAAESLKKIFPGMDATGIDMSIPMPGHPIPPALLEKTKTDVARLEELIDKHDAVFLLMDSRESRWLPTVIGASKGKIVMNAALGFDSFLVMRHGVRASRADGDSARLGCYYCNDIVAPADSLSDRTLDQMCTVTRPGLAAIASSTGVEILVSLLQHPKGLNAPAPKPGDESSESILGVVPHQLRGFLAQFSNKLITGAAYDKCTGCSETVLKEYESRGFEMALRAFNETGYLEKLTGLDKLHADSEAAMESVDWVEGGDGEGDDDF
ncbi:ThiF family [Rhizoctonia solani]|uniref:Ubiquitin-like modifier-activating enzyme ATG7 n=1 Tax=Rhizoctonia solani TaxID=456999 RepID=A0A8H7HFK0_9AGAM|nr:ThiF family [Rhizoctonia solani]